MKIFQPLLQEIQHKKDLQERGSNEIQNLIKKVSKELLDPKYKPSPSLKIFFDKLLRRAKYPMEVAIVGQFSSGKSTFLNALLGRDILPTGITPVTSKVNYINYGDEYKLEVTYNSGAKEFHSVEHLAKFTDQRESLIDVKYLSLFAPIEMLREISFVDTPGLNSQSHYDTKTTTNILRSVDGIIWLGLIDAVAKKTELEILEEYLKNYASKSICLLNQKDRIGDDEVQTALAYAKKNYKNFFSKIIAISAKDALEARMNKKCFKSSNMQDVLDFINNEIRPKAKEAKRFSLKQTLQSAITILQDEYTSLTALYGELAEIVEDYSDAASMSKEDEGEFISGVELLYLGVEECIELYVKEIYSNIKVVPKSFAKEEKTLFAKRWVKGEYDSFALLESSFDRSKTKNLVTNLHNLKKRVLEVFQQKLDQFEKELILWKVEVLQTQKIRTIASDEQRYELKYFAAGVYEEIYRSYLAAFEHFEGSVLDKIEKLSFSNRFELAYEKTISQINIAIIKMQNGYEKDPLHSVINSFDESEIKLIFQENLDFEYLKRQLRANDSFVEALSQSYKKELSLTSQESMQKIKQKFDAIDERVKGLDKIVLS